MDVQLAPTTVEGTARAPPSKSYTHRAILAAGLAEQANVEHPLLSADTRATMRAVEAFGGDVEEDPDTLAITGCGGSPAVPGDVIDCANSGTTMRLVTGTASLIDGLAVLTGDASLRSRPQGPLLAAINDLGGRAESTADDGTAPLVVGGPVDGGSVAIPGDVSSQFISSLLMAGGLTDEGIEIELETPLKSAPYVDITIEVLDAFGVDAAATEDGYAVVGDQAYGRSTPYDVPGDFSSASYLVAAGAVAGDSVVTVTGAHPSAQGDVAILEVVERMGATIDWDREAGHVTVGAADLRGVEVDVADTPDLLPTIATLGAAASGTTRITNCEHVRYKETDRVAAMATELDRLGAVVEEEQDTLTIDGDASTLAGGTVDGYRDHRIIMALSIAALIAEDPVTVTGADHVDVSFPAFFDVLESLGVSVLRR